MVDPQTLQKYSLFGGLDEEQIMSALSLVELENYKPDTEIIIEGMPNDRIYFMVEGEVAVTKDGAPLSRLGEGQTFGEMEVLDVMPSIATIKSLSPVTVMSISNKALREIYKVDLKAFALITMNLARDLSRRLRKMDDLIAGLSAKGVQYDL
jgi:CRP-like cAMP-binding protein